MTSPTLSTFLQQVSEYITRVLPLLTAYKRPAREEIQQQVLGLLEAYPSLALHLSVPPQYVAQPTPGAAPAKLMVLEGTVPISYCQAQYNIPVHIWLPPGFPQTPPECRVVPGLNLVVKPGHSYVDLAGWCQMAGYRQGEWDPGRCSLKGLARMMERVFSMDPPLYADPPPKASQPQQQQQQGEEVVTVGARKEEPLPPALQKAFAPGDLHTLGPALLEIQAQVLATEDVTKEDAMDDVFQELSQERILGTAFVKRTRQLAMEQFFARAKLMKVLVACQVAEQEAAAASGPGDEAKVPAQVSAELAGRQLSQPAQPRGLDGRQGQEQSLEPSSHQRESLYPTISPNLLQGQPAGATSGGLMYANGRLQVQAAAPSERQLTPATTQSGGQGQSGRYYPLVHSGDGQAQTPAGITQLRREDQNRGEIGTPLLSGRGGGPAGGQQQQQQQPRQQPPQQQQLQQRPRQQQPEQLRQPNQQPHQQPRQQQQQQQKPQKQAGGEGTRDRSRDGRSLEEEMREDELRLAEIARKTEEEWRMREERQKQAAAERRAAEEARKREEEWRRRAAEQKQEERRLWEEAKRLTEERRAAEERRRRETEGEALQALALAERLERQRAALERAAEERRIEEELERRAAERRERRSRAAAEREEEERRAAAERRGREELWKRRAEEQRAEERRLWEEGRRQEQERRQADERRRREKEQEEERSLALARAIDGQKRAAAEAERREAEWKGRAQAHATPEEAGQEKARQQQQQQQRRPVGWGLTPVDQALTAQRPGSSHGAPGKEGTRQGAGSQRHQPLAWASDGRVGREPGGVESGPPAAGRVLGGRQEEGARGGGLSGAGSGSGSFVKASAALQQKEEERRLIEQALSRAEGWQVSLQEQERQERSLWEEARRVKEDHQMAERLQREEEEGQAAAAATARGDSATAAAAAHGGHGGGGGASGGGGVGEGGALRLSYSGGPWRGSGSGELGKQPPPGRQSQSWLLEEPAGGGHYWEQQAMYMGGPAGTQRVASQPLPSGHNEVRDNRVLSPGQARRKAYGAPSPYDGSTSPSRPYYFPS